ncbi:unnamed protein product [Closterium sp. NIES-53]
MALGQQASAMDMAMEGAEDEEEDGLEAATTTEAVGVADTAMTTRTTDAVADGQEGRGAGGGRGRGRGGRGGRGGGAASMKTPSNESESRDDRFPGQFFFVSTQAPAGPEKDEGFEEPAAVGKVTLHSLDYWVIDSGATYSMTPRADLLTELEPSPVKHVTSALGQRAEVKGMGKAMFKGADGKMVDLKNVLWLPNLAANLISVRRLQKAGMDTSSKGAKNKTARLSERIIWDLHEDRDVYNEMCQIPVVPMPKERQVAASISTKGEAVRSGDGANGRAKEIKSKKCNLGGTSKLGEHEESGAAFQKQHKGEENPKAAAEEEYGECMWGTIARAAFSNPTSATGECDWLTLHRRMGHVALPILQQLVKNEMVAGIRVKGEPDEVLGCPTCMQAKFTRYPFSSSEATAKAPLDEVVMDVVGTLKLGASGAEYFLTIVDVYTRMTWVYVLSKKSDVAETVKTDWLPMVERQQDRLVKAIRTNGGGEFLSKKNGIRHSLTMPYSPAMNGIAERANRTITETARGLLIEAGLPDNFWPYAVRCACVAKNRALTHVGADKWVPYVEWIGRKPKVDMLRVFGCMCMAIVPKHLRHNKLGAKAIWAVHLGMAQNSKGWLLWDPFTKKFLVSRDCKFMENLMYKDWMAKNEGKIGMRFGDVKSSGLEHVELPLELRSGSTTTRQYFLVNVGEKAKDTEEEEEEVQQLSERALTLPSRSTSAPRIRVTPQQRQGLHVPAAEEEGRGNRLTYDALGKPAKSALAGAALLVGDDEESDYDECAFAFFSPVEMPGEPAALKEALESSDAEEWKKAMESELKSIEENGTWELVELPKGRKAITSKWLFKIKSDADGKIERYKSRLVAKGYQQKEKVEYKELFAPVMKPTTLRTLLAGAAIKRWVVKHMDVTTAFLNGVLEKEIFMAQPEGFDDGSGRVLRLKKALYGLKQAPRQCYLKLRGVLEEIGFTPSTADHSLFMLGEGEQRSFMVVYVDDILIFSPSSDLVKEVMLKLEDKFKCKALGDVSFYLGLHIERDVEKRCMRVHQRKYLEALAANFGQSEGHVATPFPSGFKCVKGPEEESVGEEERRRFHSLVGSLMCAAVNTRPDVAFATGQLARVVQCPNEEQVAAGMRVAKYLGQTATVGLQYSAAAQRRQKGADGVEPGRLFLTAFSDASYASEPEDMIGVGGFICCVGGGPTAWESKKQVDQALSSVESECMALFRAVREIVWQRRLLAELGEEQQGPTPLYCDSREDVRAASTSRKRRNSKGKGGRGSGGGSGGGGGGSGSGSGGSDRGGGGSGGGGGGGTSGGGGGSGGSGSSRGGGTSGGWSGPQRGGPGGGRGQQQWRRSETQTAQQLRWRCVGVPGLGFSCLCRDPSADKLSACAIPCVFLGFVPGAPGWQFYHPTLRRVLPSQDITFYWLFPYRSAPSPPPPLFLAPGPPPVDPVPPRGTAPLGVSQVDPLFGFAPVQVAVISGAAPSVASGGAPSGGAEPGGAGSEGAGSEGVEPDGVEPEGVEPGGAESEGAEPGGAESEGAESRGAEPWGAVSFACPAGASPRLSSQELRAAVTPGTGDPTEPRAAGAGGAGAGVVGVGGSGAGGAGAEGAGAVDPGAGGAGGTVRPRPYFVPLLQHVLGVPSSTGLPPPFLCPPPDQSQPPLQPASPLPVPSPYTEQSRGLTERREPVSRPVLLVRIAPRAPRSLPPPVPGTHTMALRPSSVPLRVPLPAPPESSLPEVPDPESDRARTASPTVARLLATAIIDPSFESAAPSALVAELLDFATACRLDYASALVAESVPASPPSVGGECALGTDVLEDRKEDFECLAAAVPRLASMLLALEGDPDAPDILTPRSYAEAITGPYSFQWQAAMDVEMASWKSTGTYVDEVPPPGVNIVDGMLIFRVKRPPGSPPAFKACYVARGFSQRQGVDYFQSFSPNPKMTTLRVLLHVAAQRDYKLHSMDFRITFLQGSLHEEIRLCRPLGFTGSFPTSTQWSLRRPVYGLRQAPRGWHDTLRTTLAALWFVPSTAYPSLFLRTDTSLAPFYVLVYVEDLVFATAYTEALTLVKSELQKRHTCTDLGPSALRLRVLLARAHSSVPELVGCLMYLLTCTRPDLAYPLSLLARYVALGRHRKVHWHAAKRVLRYLCSTSGMGLVLGGRGPVVLTGHADASWVDDSATQQSSQGYTFSLGSGLVSWWSTCSSLDLSSSFEAEIYAGAMAAQELRWLTYLLTDLGEQPRSPPVLYVDNKAMIALCQEHRLE